MNKTDVRGRIVEMAEPLPTEEAICAVEALINHLDVQSETYEVEVAVLLRIGATPWQLSQAHT